MGHDVSKAPNIRGNYDFSANNLDGIFEVGFDEQLSIDDIIHSLRFENPTIHKHQNLLPNDAILINIILDPKIFTTSNNSYEIWHEILLPLFLGTPDTRPHIQQLLLSFLQSLKDRSRCIYESEKNSRSALQDKINDEKLALINIHNRNKRAKFPNTENMLPHLKTQQDIIRYISTFIERRFKKVFYPHISYFRFSKLICDQLAKDPNEYLAYMALRWGIAASELAPMIDSFVQLTKYSIAGLKTSRKLSFHIFANNPNNYQLTNVIFIPSSSSLIGSSSLSTMDIPVYPTPSSIFSDGKHLFMLGKRGFLIIVSLAKTAYQKRHRIQSIELNIQNKDRSPFYLIGSNNNLLITNKNSSQAHLFAINPLKRISEPISYQSDTLFGTPKIKPPFASDGHFIYCIDSPKRISVFSITSPPVIRFHKYIEFQSSNASLIVPYDRSLVPKEWLSASTVTLFTNGIVLSFLILRRSDQTNFSYFMRHFSLVDGSHISDIGFTLKWPLLSLSIDPWNGCIWSLSPNNENVAILKMNLTCSAPPWFTGSSNFQPLPFTQTIQALSGSETLAAAVSSFRNFLSFYSYNFFNLPFRCCISNPQYNIKVAHTFAPCTLEALKSLMNAIYYFANTYLDTFTNKVALSKQIKISLVTCVRLLEYNLLNFETRTNESKTQVILLDSNAEVLNCLLYLLNNSNFAFIHRLTCFTIVSCFSTLFKNDQTRCAEVFSLIYHLMSEDFVFFMIQKLHNLPIFPYCFTADICKDFFQPILESLDTATPDQVEMLLMFERSLLTEMNSIYTNTPIDIIENYNNRTIQETFFTYSSIMLNKISDLVKSLPSKYKEQALDKSPFFPIFNSWIILFQPFSTFARASPKIAELIRPIFELLTKRIKEFQLESPINDTNTGFHLIYSLFFEIFSVYIESLVSLLDGGSELSDTTRYSWLIRSTMSSGINMEEINEILTVISNHSIESPSSQEKLAKGLSFSIGFTHQKDLLNEIKEETFLLSIISSHPNNDVIELFNFLYQKVPNRFNKRLNDHDKHFERIVFVALMKQLGLYHEIVNLHDNFSKQNSQTQEKETNNENNVEEIDNDIKLDNNDLVITHYMKQAMETVYRIRMILNVSKQQTRQLELAQQDEVLPNSTDSLNQNYPKYREEVMRKCIFLLHIEPCLRFLSESFEQAFSDFLKKLQSFMISEIPLDQYFTLISKSENSKINVSLGLELINDILSSDCEIFCKDFLIEQLTASSNFLTFLSATSIDSFNNAAQLCIDKITTLLNLLISLMKSDQCLNVQVVLFLNLIIMIQNHGDNVIFQTMSTLIDTIKSFQKNIDPHNFQSYLAFILTALYVLYENNKDLSNHTEFQSIVRSIISNSLKINELSLYRIALKMEIPTTITINDFIDFYQKLEPADYYAATNILFDLILREQQPNCYYLWILNEISQICSGGNPHLMLTLPLITSCDPLKYKTVKTPGSLLAGAASLIHLCRMILTSPTNAKHQLYQIFERILSKSKDKGSFNNPILLYGVFAVLSNSIEVFRVNSFVRNNRTNNIYFIDSFNKNGYSGWQLPINGNSAHSQLLFDSPVEPISIIPFTSQMYPNVDILLPYFLNHLFNEQNQASDESLSFYVLSCLIEYYNDKSILIKLMKQIPEESKTHFIFGDSSKSFLNLLRIHLSIDSDGFCTKASINPKTTFYEVSYLTNNIHCYSQISNNSCLMSNAGINLFMSNILRLDREVSVTLTIPPVAEFDAGLFMPSTQMNSTKILMIAAHEGFNEYLYGNELKKIETIPSKISITFSPATQQGWITDEENHSILMGIKFRSASVLFFVCLYRQSHIQYKFSDNDDHNVRKSYVSPSKSNHLPTLQPVPQFSNDEEDVIKPSTSIVDYYTTGIEISLQKITMSLPNPEPLKYANVILPEKTYLGYSIPPNLIFQYSKNNLITRIIKARPVISSSKTDDSFLLLNSAYVPHPRIPSGMKSIKQPSIHHNNRPSLPSTRNNYLITPKMVRQTSANQPFLKQGAHLAPLQSQSSSEISDHQMEENTIEVSELPSIEDKKIINVAIVDDISGHVSRVNSDIFDSLNFLPPFHPSNLSSLPPALINHQVYGLIQRMRRQTCNMIMINSFSNHKLTISSLIKHMFNDVNSTHHFFLSILTYIEPISPSDICIGKSPIDFSFNILDSDAQFKSSFSSYHIVIQRILSYIAEHKKVDLFINTWRNLLISDFHNQFRHFISLDHEFAYIISVSSETTSIHLTHNDPICWIIFYDGFGNTLNQLKEDAKVVFYTDESENEIELGNEIICIKKQSVEGLIINNKPNNDRNIIAIPCFNDNESLFQTFFELIISFKYFVHYVKSKFDELSNDVLKSIRFTIYSLFCDGFTARSPFFVTFGSDFLQFLTTKLPILTSDLNDSFIYKLSLLSVYTPPDEYKYIHSFIEEQQNLLDELYIFGTNDFLYNDKPVTNTIGDNYDETLLTETTSSYFVTNQKIPLNPNTDFLSNNLSPSNRAKFFESPFPDSISNDENLVKIMNNVKRVLTKRRDIHSCPFHLLFHKWAQYSHRYPPTTIETINANTIKMKFSFFTPKTFHFVFQVMPKTTRFCISYESNFQNARYLVPDVSIPTKGHSILYISIADDPDVTFASLNFFVEAEDPFSIESFLKNYRNHFVLDGKTFFIHWSLKHDQTLLSCFSVKPYYRSSMSLNFNPVDLLNSHLNYSMNLLCCRIYFLMILNFYYTKSRNEFGKDSTLHSFLPSISMKIKMTKFQKLYSRSNETEGDFIKINRKAAFEVRDGQSNNLNLTLISQLSEVYTSPIRFRLAKDTPWKVQLIGEQGCDVGGLARELVTEAATDLISPTCGLVVPVPNAVVGYGNCQNLVIPIPNPGQANILKQYKFAGALIGIAIRSGLTQDFNFPPLVWEYLMTGTISIERVFEIDHNFQSLITGLKQAMRSIAPSHITSPTKATLNVTPEKAFFDGSSKAFSENYITPNSFSHDSLSEMSTLTDNTEQWKSETDESSESSAAPIPSNAHINTQTASSIIDRFNLRFVVQSSSGSEVLLTQRGFDETVTLSNAETYISMACEFRLNEMKEYLDAMSNGLWENLDMKPPKYLDWQTLEYAACGEKEVPLSSLKKIISFFEVPDDQQQIFWDVLDHFTSEQRSLLLKFATGRIRLPAQIKGSSFLTVDYVFGEIDKMPTASTCFNQLHLPRYTSFDKAYKLISLAIEYTGTFEIG